MKTKGSWNEASGWYNKIVGNKGHYYHVHLVIPGVLKLLQVNDHDSVIDFGCGNGILERELPKPVNYLGLDVADELLIEAKRLKISPTHRFEHADVTQRQQFHGFTKAVAILSLQNFQKPEVAIENMSKALEKGGQAVVVINHPCFRIARQSGWKIDEQNKQQYRWVQRYLSPLEIPITIHPGQKESTLTWDFHYPISTYSEWFNKSGLAIELIEEWVSDKQSEGRQAKMENRSRSEIPLFMALKLIKL